MDSGKGNFGNFKITIKIKWKIEPLITLYPPDHVHHTREGSKSSLYPKGEKIVDKTDAWLKAFLAGGVKDCEEVKAAALKAGISKKDLRDARVRLGVVSSSITAWGLPKEGEA